MANKYFYFGAFVSLFLYSLIGFFLFLSLSNKQNKTLYANKNRVSFEISIVSKSNPTPILQKQERPKEIPLQKKSINKVKIDGGTSLKQKDTSLDSLFDDISDTIEDNNFTTKIIQPKKTIQSRKKGNQLKSNKNRASDIVKQIKNKTHKIIFQSTTGKESEYFSKVHQIIASKWIPNNNDYGLSSTIILEINRYGKLQSFKITKLSNNQSFDTKLFSFLESLKSIEFPINNKNSIIEFIFKVTE